LEFIDLNRLLIFVAEGDCKIDSKAISRNEIYFAAFRHSKYLKLHFIECLHFGSNQADAGIRINTEIRIRIPDHFWLRQLESKVHLTLAEVCYNGVSATRWHAW